MICVEDLHVSFGATEVLKGVNLEVAPGEISVVVGASGCGKSTLLRTLIGFVRPKRGEVEVAGQNIGHMRESELREVRKDIGMVFQHAALFDSMTVEENIRFPLHYHTRLSRADKTAKADALMEALELAEARHRLPAELSGGMRKRVGLARALVLEPSILLYDEPTTGLDPLLTRHIDELILQTRDRYNVTSVVVSHDLKSVSRIADRVTFLSDGKVLESASYEAFMASENPEVREFVGAFIN